MHFSESVRGPTADSDECTAEREALLEKARIAGHFVIFSEIRYGFKRRDRRAGTTKKGPLDFP